MGYTCESASPRHATLPPLPAAEVVDPSWQIIEMTLPSEDVKLEASTLMALRSPSADCIQLHCDGESTVAVKWGHGGGWTADVMVMFPSTMLRAALTCALNLFVGCTRCPKPSLS